MMQMMFVTALKQLTGKRLNTFCKMSGQRCERHVIKNRCLRFVGNIKEERQRMLMCVLRRIRERRGCRSFCSPNA